ncbi:MAG: hypothetical protein JO033_02750 [Acidobacteriaceae bacterium]|nr:hypothetical protein [Acidobacteriaceae bacterium]MBV9500500.1 hypothetical protein [Acidobacteriaceae bacterium]
MSGAPISISVKPGLAAWRGRLLSGSPEQGAPVYAASFMRARRVVLDQQLFRRSAPLRLIVVHELFHFAWPRLSNQSRRAFELLLKTELHRGARGELGESSAAKKRDFGARQSRRAWRDYVCESFCDTAAWLYSGLAEHPDFTLRSRWRNRRRLWFESYFDRVRPC